MGNESQADAVLTPRAIPDQVVNDLVNALQPILRATTSGDASLAAANLVHGSQDGNIFRNGPANVGDKKDISSQTVELVKQANANVQRAGVTVSTGYVGYDLKMPAATIVPFMSPLINLTPREGGVGVPVHNWKAIVDFFGGSGPQGVIGAAGEGTTPQYLARTVVPLSNTFQTIGLQDALTFQAQWRGRQLEGDMKAMLTSQLLYALKLVEENWLINMSDKLFPPAPALATPASTGGTIAAGSYFVSVTAVNANGESLGSTTIGPITTTGATSSISFTFFTVPFAASYNVYIGTSNAPAAMWRQSAATNFGSASALNQPANQVAGSFTATLTSLTTSGTALSASANNAIVSKDASNNPLTWQGALALVYNNVGVNTNNGTGGLKSQVMQPAATTGFLALTDIQNLFLAMFLNARANPEYLFVSPQDSITIDNLVTAAGNTRVVVDATQPMQQNSLTAGFRVGRILNQVTQRLVQIIPLPFLAQGTMIAGSFSFPFPVAGFSTTPFRIITNQEYYGVEYPPTRQNPMDWGMGDYVDSTVCNEYLGGWGVINGIVYH